MTTYDAAMVIVVVLGMVRGAWRGFTWQMASIASLVVGYTAAHTASARFASYLPGEPEVQRMLAMGVVYIAVSGGIFGIAWMIRGTLRKLKFEAYDRHLGMLLGGLEGLGAGMLATMFVVSLAPATRQPIFSCTTGRAVGTVMNNLGPVLPDEVRKVLTPHWDGTFTPSIAAHEVDENGGRSGDPADTTAGVALSSQLPAPDEADTGGNPAAASALPALPALESPAAGDRAVKRASGSHRFQGASSLAGPRDGAGLSGVLEQGRQEVEQAVSDSIDRQLERLGGLKSTSSKGRQ
jgi:membrane protein required for colicin V production